MIDDLIALRLQLEWGVDEALGDTPVDRFAQLPSAVALRPPPVLDAEPTLLRIGRVAPAVQAQTLEALHAELDAFTACPLRATATHTVRPSGAVDASILLIGDAPGSEDDRSGQAFTGPPGALLDRVLASIGLDRQRMLLTTLVPWRP
ncbi:MAG: uracil-DNA glycosylase family protein, partial [Janthinobacterium lividum]